METNIRIIRPSSRYQSELLYQRINYLKKHGIQSTFQRLPQDIEIRNFSSSITTRSKEFNTALCDPSIECIVAARGGYGASDLLPLIPWQELKHLPPKLLIGFSDISALQSALWTKLAWPSVHGPMPETDLWGQNENTDIEELIQIIKHPDQRTGTLNLTLSLNDRIPSRKNGWLFGGCFSVLTALIGTSYFPSNLKHALIFLEDTNENSGTLNRMWNQWMQAGALDNCLGIVLGNLRGLETEEEQLIKEYLAKKVDVPVWSSEDFGHLSPNHPIIIGAKATVDLEENLIKWSLS